MPRVIPTQWDKLIYRGRIAARLKQRADDCPFAPKSAEGMCWLAGLNGVTVSRETRDEWRKDEIARLQILTDAGVPGRVIELVLNRTHQAVRAKLSRRRRHEKVAA
jgi:hypothetical protein